MNPIAISFGGSTCSVAVWFQDAVELIYNEHGHGCTPSCVAYTDRTILVGEPAVDQQHLNPRNTIYDVASFIGRKLCDAEVQKGIKVWPFKLSSKDSLLCVEVMRAGETRLMLPEEILSRLLSHMKGLAEAYLGSNVSQAVITVPNCFNDSQRQAVRDAAVLSGLSVMRMYSENIATIIGCEALNAKDRGKVEKCYVVCKWGGLSLTATMLLAEEGDYQALAQESIEMGGRMMDNRIRMLVWEQLRKQTSNEELKRPAISYAIQRACEAAKIALSDQTDAVVEVELTSGGVISAHISRSTFESHIQDFLGEAARAFDRMLLKACMTKADVSEVIISGGTCCLPTVKNAIMHHFRREPISVISPLSTSPTLAPVRGAALQSAILCGSAVGSNRTAGMMLVDVTMLNFGVAIMSTDLAGAQMQVIMPRDTTIPVRRMTRFTTAADHQTTARVDVYEGMFARTLNNTLIATLVLTDIPPAPRGVPIIEVSLFMDPTLYLRINVCDVLRPSKSVQFTVSYNEARDRHAQLDVLYQVQQLKRLCAMPASDEAAMEARSELVYQFSKFRHQLHCDPNNNYPLEKQKLSTMLEGLQHWLAARTTTLLRAAVYQNKLADAHARFEEITRYWVVAVRY